MPGLGSFDLAGRRGGDNNLPKERRDGAAPPDFWQLAVLWQLAVAEQHLAAKERPTVTESRDKSPETPTLGPLVPP
jgi:hypothetical protein